MPEIIFVAGETASRRASDRRRSQQTRPPNAPNLESAVSIDARHSPFSMPLPKKNARLFGTTLSGHLGDPPLADHTRRLIGHPEAHTA